MEIHIFLHRIQILHTNSSIFQKLRCHFFIDFLLLLFLLRAQLLQALLLIAGNSQFHRDFQGEDVLHRLGEAGGHVLLGHVGHAEGVGEGQRDAVIQAAPVDLIHPGDGGGVIALQEVRQHGLVGADIVLEVLLEARGHDAQGQGLLGEEPPQDALHLQEGGREVSR